MIFKSKHKKRTLLRRSKNKVNHLGGAIPNLSEIDALIKNMENDDHDKTLSKLEKYANLMTIQHTYDLIIHSITNLEEVMQSSSDYKKILPILSNLLKTDFDKYPNIFENIQKLITDLFPLSLDTLTTNYSTFPISKINPKLGKIRGNKLIKIYDGESYELVGAGGFGSVYVNVDENQAIKKISNLDPDMFKREALNYNNISSLLCNTNYFCKFKNCFIDFNWGRTLYVLMEYCGKNLITTLNEQKNSQDVSIKTLLEWFITIAKGIECMHDNGYVHLDIKPINITIYENEAKLIDFGLAHYVNDITEQLYMGTLNFMAPEMVNSEQIIDYKFCDIYSLGVTFAFCIFVSLFKKDEELPEDENSEDDLEDISTDKRSDEELLSLIGLASMVSDDPTDRPTIQEVIKKLKSVSTDRFFENMFKMNGYSTADLRDAGFNANDLYDGGYNALELFKAGYKYGEIRDMYKKNKYAELTALLNHCDKKREGFKRHTSKDCSITTICSSNPHLPECKKPPSLETRRSRKIRETDKKKSKVKSIAEVWV